ncbi:MAG: hypothetical protein NTU58_02910 [Candidatus Nealsonbacteria bacterium]|nr:hypothetical protein [Candidatus Nealsonbacteria bacterium]
MKNLFKISNLFILFFFISWLFVPSIISATNSYTITDRSVDPAKVYKITYDGLNPCGKCCATNILWAASVVGECNQKTAGGDPVPIGTLISRKWIPCTICHFFVMADGILDLILIKIVPAIAVLIFTIGGFSLYQAGQNPQKTSFAKKILTSATIGLVLIYGSWLIINTILVSIKVSEWTGLVDNPATPEKEGWFQVKCDIRRF